MDIAAPGVFVMQGVARWGNFFNQELYGPPTNLPWGIAIDCAHRVAEYACPPGSDPGATLGQHFQPLFLYESISGFLGAATLLWLARRFPKQLRPGDIAMIFIIWYSLVRFSLEYMRAGYNWTFFGIPTAQVVSLLFVAFAILVLVYRHRPGARVEPLTGQDPADDEPLTGQDPADDGPPGGDVARDEEPAGRIGADPGAVSSPPA
jgi:phosphatidylglycerol:prolipoprotein diacylglycerol transferase